MSELPLLSIHYDGKITVDHNGSVVFCSNQPLFIRMPPDVRSLVALKNFVAYAIGVQDTKRVTKIYYRYPMEVDGNFQFKSRYRLRDDEDVKLIRVDRCEGGSANASVDTQSAGPASRNIIRMMVNLNESPGGSNDGFNYGVDSEPLQGMLPEEFESHEEFVAGDPMTESFHLDPDQDDGRDEDEEELNSLRISQTKENVAAQIRQGDTQECDGKPMIAEESCILLGSAAPTVLPDTSAGTRRPAQPSPTTSGHNGQDPPTVVAISCELESLRRLGTTSYLSST
ncbi:hypothetical protein PIB30_059478 [Stylosanthes scabra]|uniref:Uncharacterized protein n=1 Tax=Stylosanthes scabra TaxID=79078 RepID=A0ABU6QKZ5_9FABA|nr:hypothetical protein [Stylosanthes scabra]